MLSLSVSTEFNKRIPKQKFYENMEVSPAMKKAFAEQIKLIYWRNKLAVSTMNIAPGEMVTEIEVIELKLASPQLNEAVLKLIDKAIPYHILFLLEYEGKAQAWIGYKEAATSGNSAFKVSRYYHTDWMPEHALNLKIEGLNMDAIWENLIAQIGGIKIGLGKSLGEQIRIDDQKAKLQKEIEKLEKQARAEKQPKKKFELVAQKRKLENELGRIGFC